MSRKRAAIASHRTDVDCDRCGKRVDVRRWHSATTETNSDTTTAILTFCSSQCREAFEKQDCANH